LNLDPRERARLAERIRGRLAEAVPGSASEVQGSLARGGADPYSDIDVLWEIPDDRFDWCLRGLQGTLSGLHPLESLRIDPEFQDSRKRRRVHVRFEGFPLFWQCDIEIICQSIRRDLSFDVGNPSARGPDRSAGESMLMGTVAAMRAYLRGEQSLAQELLDRALARMGMSAPDVQGSNPMLSLVGEVERRYPQLEPLAERVRGLIREVLAERARGRVSASSQPARV
jgi:predicted nucleotidyltransferase